MAGFDAGRVLGKPRTPFLDLQLGRGGGFTPAQGDFAPDDPLQGGTRAQLGRFDPTYQTTGAVAQRKQSESSDFAELVLDSLGPNARPDEVEYLRQVISNAGAAPNEEETSGIGKLFSGFVNVIDAPRRLVMAGVADVFNVGGEEAEFSSMEAFKRILGGKPSNDPDKQQGLENFTSEEGELLFTGSQLLRAAGWGEQGDDDEVGLFQKIARGTVGFGLDMLLDPLNWVTWGTLGLGKAAASAAARSGVADATLTATKAYLAREPEKLAGFAEFMFKHLDDAGKPVRDKIFEEAAERRAKELGVKKLSGEARDKLRLEVDDAWWKMQGDAAQARVTGRWDDYVPSTEIDETDWLTKRIAGTMDDSPVKSVYEEIDTLVTNKQFKTLERQYSSFITDTSMPSIAKGGMTVTTPFMRKQVGGVNLGLFRGDRRLTEPARKVISEVWQKMPYEGVRGSIEGVYKRWGTDIAEREARKALGAWDVDGAIALSKVIFRNMGVEDAPQELASQLRHIGIVAKEQGASVEDAYMVLARTLDEGWDDGFARQALNSNEAMYEAVKSAQTSTKATLKVLHGALKKIHPTMGEIEDYFPLLPSKEFNKLLERMAEQGATDPAVRAMRQALEGGSGLSNDVRIGLQLLSQFHAEMVSDIATMARNGAGEAGKAAVMNARIPGKTLFSPLSGVDLKMLNPEVLDQLMETGVKPGWQARVDMNRMIKAALKHLEDTGAFKGGINMADDAFSMNLPDVLETYIKNTSRVIHYNALIDEATRIGIVTSMDDALDIGRTLHEALQGPLSDAQIALRRETRKFLKGDKGAPTSTWVDVIDGWAVNIPREIADDPRVVEALSNLRKHAVKAAGQTADHLAALEKEVVKLVDEGIPEWMAREMTIVTTDTTLREAQTAIFSAMADEVATMKANIHDLLAGVHPERRVEMLKVADGLAAEWVRQTEATIKGLNDQYRELFGFEKISSDSVTDLLAADPKTGGIPLAVFERQMQDKVNELMMARAKKYLSPEQVSMIESMNLKGDVSLSFAKALEAEVAEKIWPAATEKAWKKVAAMTRATNLTTQELADELGAHRTIKILRDLSGWTPPSESIDDLVDVAEEFASRNGRPYTPRVADRVGKPSEILDEYRSVPNVEIINEEVGDLTENGMVSTLKFIKFRNEAVEQITELEARGYKFVPFTGKGSPYKSFRHMVKDVIDNKRILVNTVVDARDPMPLQELIRGIPAGNLFDALHIVMGHGMHGIMNDSIADVTTAWLNHGQLFSQDAREIFTTLTRGRRVAHRVLKGQEILPRKIAVMHPEITALNLDDWEANGAFAVLSRRHDYRDWQKAADGVDNLKAELKEIEGESATGFRLTEAVEGTPASKMPHPKTGVETEYYALTYRGNGNPPVVHWTQKDYDKWVLNNRRKAAAANRRAERTLDRVEGKIQAAPPIGASEKGAFISGIPTSPFDPAFDEAVARDLQRLNEYWTEVHIWQERVLQHMGPNGEKNRAAFKALNDALKAMSKSVDTSTVGEAGDVSRQMVDKWIDKFPLTGDFDIRKGRKPFVTADEWLGLQPPTTPTMEVLRQADIEDFPTDFDLGGLNWWMETFEDPDQYQTWKESFGKFKTERDTSDTVNTLITIEEGKGYSTETLRQTPHPDPTNKSLYETKTWDEALLPYEGRAKGPLRSPGQSPGTAVDQAVRQMRDDAAKRIAVIDPKTGRKVWVRKDQSDRLVTRYGTKRVPNKAPQVELVLRSGETKILPGGIGGVDAAGRAAAKAKAYNDSLRRKWEAASSGLKKNEAELAARLKGMNLNSLFDEIPDDVLSSGFDHPIFRQGVLEDLATAAEVKRRRLAGAKARPKEAKPKAPKGQKPGKTAKGEQIAKIGDADPESSWVQRHAIEAYEGAESPRQAARNHLDVIRKEADELANSIGLGGLLSKSGNADVTLKQGKHTATVAGSSHVTATTNLFRGIREALAGAAADGGRMLARHEDDLRTVLNLIGLDADRLVVEPMADGSFRFLYNNGDFAKTFHMIPPEDLREVLDDWLPYPTAGLSLQQLTSMVADLVEDGTFSLDVLPEGIRKFIQTVPDGVLPFDVDDFDYLKRLVPELEAARLQLKSNLKSAVHIEKNRAAKALSEIVEKVDPFVRRRKGDLEALDDAWDRGKKVLEKVLSDEDFNRVARLVEQAPAIRTATAHSRSLMAGNVSRRWTPVSEVFQAFDRARNEVIEEMFQSGAELAHAEEIAGLFDDFERHLMGIQSEYALPSKTQVGVHGQAMTDSYDQLTTNPEKIARFTEEVKQAEDLGTLAASEIWRLSGDEGYQWRVLRELKDLLPSDVDKSNIQQWLKKQAQQMKEPMPIRKAPVTTRPNLVQATAAGVVSHKLDGKMIDASFNMLLENLASHINAAYTPLGLRLMSEQLRGFERYWKAAVTVARPTFVPRNVLGGVFNNTAINVGVRDYAWVSSKARQIRVAMKKSNTFEEALQGLVSKGRMTAADADVFRQARIQRIFDAEFTSDIADPLLGKANRSWNPFAGLRPGSDKTFAVFDMGGEFMQTSEDFLRMAAFKRWYDPNSPGSAYFAQQLTFAVHFDYASLTNVEKRIKKFIPFYVWTRRNIPLQAQLMMERPGIWNRYANIQREAETAFEDREYTFTDRQPTPSWMGNQAADLDMVVDRGEGQWLRMFLDPDLPARDLEQLVGRFSSGNVIRNAWGFLSDSLSPVITLPFEEVGFEDEERWRDKVVAPTGLSEVLKALNAIGVYQGDMRGDMPIVGRNVRNVWEAAFPYLREWTEMSGIAPADPMRAGDLGYRLDDGISLEERALGAFMGVGKAFGLRGSTPHDTLQPVLQAQRKVQDIQDRAIAEGRLPPEGAQGAPREYKGVQSLSDVGGYRTLEQQSSFYNKPPVTGNLVVDGDTLKLKQADGTYDRVRLIGVNTPEAGELGASAAADFISSVINTGGTVRVVKDIVETDAYGRTLAYVWVGDRMLNLELIQRGLAQPQPYSPNLAFERLLNG